MLRAENCRESRTRGMSKNIDGAAALRIYSGLVRQNSDLLIGERCAHKLEGVLLKNINAGLDRTIPCR